MTYKLGGAFRAFLPPAGSAAFRCFRWPMLMHRPPQAPFHGGLNQNKNTLESPHQSICQHALAERNTRIDSGENVLRVKQAGKEKRKSDDLSGQTTGEGFLSTRPPGEGRWEVCRARIPRGDGPYDVCRSPLPPGEASYEAFPILVPRGKLLRSLSRPITNRNYLATVSTNAPWPGENSSGQHLPIGFSDRFAKP